MLILPPDIDYSKYESTSGRATSKWGSSAWTFLFTSIMGTYPVKIDEKREDHIMIKYSYKCMLVGLQTTMPCIYCRESFKQFLKELPIEPFLTGRIKLMYWLYLMKDKVNKKLLAQEKQCYNDEKLRLKDLYKMKKITKDEYYKKISQFKIDTLKTKSSIPFKEVLDKYENIRAVCSKKAKTCALPKKL